MVGQHRIRWCHRDETPAAFVPAWLGETAPTDIDFGRKAVKSRMVNRNYRTAIEQRFIVIKAKAAPRDILAHHSRAANSTGPPFSSSGVSRNSTGIATRSSLRRSTVTVGFSRASSASTCRDTQDRPKCGATDVLSDWFIFFWCQRKGVSRDRLHSGAQTCREARCGGRSKDPRDRRVDKVSTTTSLRAQATRCSPNCSSRKATWQILLAGWRVACSHAVAGEHVRELHTYGTMLRTVPGPKACHPPYRTMSG